MRPNKTIKPHPKFPIYNKVKYMKQEDNIINTEQILNKIAELALMQQISINCNSDIIINNYNKVFKPFYTWIHKQRILKPQLNFRCNILRYNKDLIINLSNIENSINIPSTLRNIAFDNGMNDRVRICIMNSKSIYKNKITYKNLVHSLLDNVVIPTDDICTTIENYMIKGLNSILKIKSDNTTELNTERSNMYQTYVIMHIANILKMHAHIQNKNITYEIDEINKFLSDINLYIDMKHISTDELPLKQLKQTIKKAQQQLKV